MPDVLVAHVAMLAPPVLLSQVDKRCHASVSERCTNLAALLDRAVFDIGIDVILGSSGGARLRPSWMADAHMVVLARACASGALARCTDLVATDSAVGDKGLAALSGALATGAMGNLKALSLRDNLIGDAGMQAFASACAGGAMAQLQVSSHPSALSSGLDTWHVQSADPDISFDVQYAGALAQQQSDWGQGPRGLVGVPRHRRHAAARGTLPR